VKTVSARDECADLADSLQSGHAVRESLSLPLKSQKAPRLYQKIKALAAVNIDGSEVGQARRQRRRGAKEDNDASSDEERVARVVGWAADYLSSDDDESPSMGGPGSAQPPSHAPGLDEGEEIEDDLELQLTMRALLMERMLNPPHDEEASQPSEIREELNEEVEVDAQWDSDEFAQRTRLGPERAGWGSMEFDARGRAGGERSSSAVGIYHSVRESMKLFPAPSSEGDELNYRRQGGQLTDNDLQLTRHDRQLQVRVEEEEVEEVEEQQDVEGRDAKGHEAVAAEAKAVGKEQGPGGRAAAAAAAAAAAEAEAAAAAAAAAVGGRQRSICKGDITAILCEDCTQMAAAHHTCRYIFAAGAAKRALVRGKWPH